MSSQNNIALSSAFYKHILTFFSCFPFSPSLFSPLVSYLFHTPSDLFTHSLSLFHSYFSLLLLSCSYPLSLSGELNAPQFMPPSPSLLWDKRSTTAVPLCPRLPPWSHCRGYKWVQGVSRSELQVSLPQHPRSLQGSCWWTEQLSSLQRLGLSHRKTDVSLRFSCLHYLPR